MTEFEFAAWAGVLLGVAWLVYRARTARGISAVFDHIMSIWAALGPFINGWESAEALRCAWIAVLGSVGEPNLLNQHADSYNAHPLRWESIRVEKLKATTPNPHHFAKAKRLLDRGAR
jgi:hypothetical protein